MKEQSIVNRATLWCDNPEVFKSLFDSEGFLLGSLTKHTLVKKEKDGKRIIVDSFDSDFQIGFFHLLKNCPDEKIYYVQEYQGKDNIELPVYMAHNKTYTWAETRYRPILHYPDGFPEDRQAELADIIRPAFNFMTREFAAERLTICFLHFEWKVLATMTRNSIEFEIFKKREGWEDINGAMPF